MKKHVCRMLLISIAMVVMAPSPADAGLLSWLSRLSGPGPFWGLEGRLAICPEKEDGVAIRGGAGFTVPCPDSLLEKREVTIYIVGGFAVAEDNPLNYGDSGRQEVSTAVRFFKVGGSVDYNLFPSLDVGIGAGGFYFNGPRFDNFWQPYGEARATFRPLVLLAFPERDDVERSGWLLLSASRVLLVGRITGADFGAPLDPLNEKDELLWSFDVSIDVLRLMKNFQKQ